MDYASLVLHPGCALRGWGQIRDDADGSWFEPSHAIPLARAGVHRRWRHAVRLYDHDPAAVATGFGHDGAIPGWATITGMWQGDSIQVTSTSPVPWRNRFTDSTLFHGPRHPTNNAELVAAGDSLAPHREEWTVASSGRWLDLNDRPHFSLDVCRVTPGLAEWASSHPGVRVHFNASLLPVVVDPVAAADWTQTGRPGEYVEVWAAGAADADRRSDGAPLPVGESGAAGTGLPRSSALHPSRAEDGVGAGAPSPQRFAVSGR